jgi:hypothetical protein
MEGIACAIHCPYLARLTPVPSFHNLIYSPFACG